MMNKRLQTFVLLTAGSIMLAGSPTISKEVDDTTPPLSEDVAAIESAPDRLQGDGPYERLILRGGTLIDGTGAPPLGPVDIV
ncbi:MAG: hypothetical protein OEM62_11715, partial [Acidobacteriota bacterium]|nr:hypothetical protein [Acidobacteriota bacterium]